MTVAEALSSFPRERTWLLPALQAAQRAERWLSPDTLEAVAAHLRVPKSEVWGVASHYPEFRLAQPAARIIRVCTGLACAARGGNDLLAHALRRAPGDITLEPMDCAFACAVAPVVEADHGYHGGVTVATLDALLDAPSTRHAPAPATGPTRSSKSTRRWASSRAGTPAPTSSRRCARRPRPRLD